MFLGEIFILEDNQSSRWERLKQLLVQGAHLEGLLGSADALVHPPKDIFHWLWYQPLVPGDGASHFWSLKLPNAYFYEI